MNTGRNASTGPDAPRPNALVPQPHWKNAVSTPNVAAAASRFITAAVARDQQAAEGDHEQQEAEPEDGEQEPGQLGDDGRGEVRVRGGHAADVDPQRRAALGGRDRAAAQGADQGGGGRGLRRGPGGDLDDLRAGRRRDRAHAGDVADVGQPRFEGPERGRAGGRAGLRDQDQRAVEAGAEAVGEQVVGLPGGAGRGVVALVGDAEPQVQHGNGQRQHHGRGHGRQRGGAPLHGGRPSGPRPTAPPFPLHARRARRELGAEAAALPPAERARAEDAEQRGQQRERGEHGEGHGERAGDRQPVEEAEAEHQDAEQRYAHRAACEQDGAARGVDRRDRGVRGLRPASRPRRCLVTMNSA